VLILLGCKTPESNSSKAAVTTTEVEIFYFRKIWESDEAENAHSSFYKVWLATI